MTRKPLKLPHFDMQDERQQRALKRKLDAFDKLQRKRVGAFLVTWAACLTVIVIGVYVYFTFGQLASLALFGLLLFVILGSQEGRK